MRYPYPFVSHYALLLIIVHSNHLAFFYLQNMLQTILAAENRYQRMEVGIIANASYFWHSLLHI